MPRLLHYVGSLPADINSDPRTGMSWILDHSDHRPLSTLPWDDNPQWIVPFLLELAERDEVLEVVERGDWTDYDRGQRYRVRPGVKLKPEHLSMRRAEPIRATLATYRELLASHTEYASVRCQQSLPSPLDLSMFTFGQRPKLLRYISTYGQALANEVADLEASDGDALVWQLEAPSILVLINKAPRPARSAIARMLARQTANFIARLPSTTTLILHLCYGNLGDNEIITPRDLAGVDVFLNALHRRLRAQNRDIPPVHVPAAYGSQPPPSNAEFYAALGRVHPDWPLIAGVVDEGAPAESRKALTLFEQAAGRTSHAIATACGLGRHSVADAEHASALMVSMSKGED